MLYKTRVFTAEVHTTIMNSSKLASKFVEVQERAGKRLASPPYGEEVVISGVTIYFYLIC